MSWTCPHCGTVATLQSSDVARGNTTLSIGTAPDEDGVVVSAIAIRCPSKTCSRYCLDVSALFGIMTRYTGTTGHGNRTGSINADDQRPIGIGNVRFEPRIQAPLSSYVPPIVKEDYEEACLIKELSPKASATLCRRALQGMIRDFWQISRRTLAEELKEIEEKCDTDIYSAMMALKGVGNISAHPERDVNLLIDVEEGEVDTLLELLRILDKEWYVAKANRAERLAAVAALGVSKAAAQKGTI